MVGRASRRVFIDREKSEGMSIGWTVGHGWPAGARRGSVPSGGGRDNAWSLALCESSPAPTPSWGVISGVPTPARLQREGGEAGHPTGRLRKTVD